MLQNALEYSMRYKRDFIKYMKIFAIKPEHFVERSRTTVAKWLFHYFLTFYLVLFYHQRLDKFRKMSCRNSFYLAENKSHKLIDCSLQCLSKKFFDITQNSNFVYLCASGFCSNQRNCCVRDERFLNKICHPISMHLMSCHSCAISDDYHT